LRRAYVFSAFEHRGQVRHSGEPYLIHPLAVADFLADMKLDALEDIIEEAQGNPVFLAYQFRSDAERIMKRFASLKPINLTECKSESSLTNAMKRWVAGDCPLMIGHAASVGHGLDGLQKRGRHLVWYGLTWSLDLYEQFNARIRRQGQGASVVCHRILVSNTIEQAQALALDGKASTQADLRRAVKDYRLAKGV
jgi:SNF2 family DNA or RNA helicase